MTTGNIQYVNSGNFTVDTNTIVEIQGSIKMRGYELPVSVKADLKDIPSNMHEAFLNMLLYTYNKTIQVYG